MIMIMSALLGHRNYLLLILYYHAWAVSFNYCAQYVFVQYGALNIQIAMEKFSQF